jgi:membrane fusion protein (multidrug efflux system)
MNNKNPPIKPVANLPIEPTETSKRPFSRKAVIAVIGAVALGLTGAIYIASPKSAVSTDNAYVQADSSIVAPKVRGLVAEVLVRQNQSVRRGDPLIRIDPEEFNARVAAAAAQLLDAQAKQDAARAALVSLDAEEQLAASNVRAARTSILSADAQSEKAQADRKRYEDLAQSGVVARHDADQFRAAAISAQADAERSRAQLTLVGIRRR